MARIDEFFALREGDDDEGPVPGANPLEPRARAKAPAPARGGSIMGRPRSFATMPRVTHDPADIDWNRPDVEVGRDLGITAKDVAVMRRSLGVAPHDAGPSTGHRPSIDWKHADSSIARDRGVDPSTVGVWRRAAGQQGTNRGFGELQRNAWKDINWGDADWSQSNQAIASRLGCSVGSVSKKRQELQSRSRTLSTTRKAD